MYTVIRIFEVEKRTCLTITLTKAIFNLNGNARKYRTQVFLLFPQGQDFSPLHVFQNGSGTHPPPIKQVPAVLSPVIKRQRRETNHSLLSNVRSRIRGYLHPLPHTSDLTLPYKTDCACFFRFTLQRNRSNRSQPSQLSILPCYNNGRKAVLTIVQPDVQRQEKYIVHNHTTVNTGSITCDIRLWGTFVVT